jgi:hypothetical protein
MKKNYLQQSISKKKCGDKEAPVPTFVANAFFPLDTAVLNELSSLIVIICIHQQSLESAGIRKRSSAGGECRGEQSTNSAHGSSETCNKIHGFEIQSTVFPCYSQGLRSWKNFKSQIPKLAFRLNLD